MEHAARGVMRTVKNYTKGYTEIQMKVRNATSNDPWGPSGAQMAEIAEATYNNHDFFEIMEILDKRLNDKGKHWRHVFKALVVLDYCIHCGSENVVSYTTKNLYVVKTLREFQHRNESGKDEGANVRQKAKEITTLLEDEERLKEARKNRLQMKDRIRGLGNSRYNAELPPSPSSSSSPATYPRRAGRQVGGRRDKLSDDESGDEDGELKRAIQESKRLAEEQERSRRESDAQLRQALEESAKESKAKDEDVAHQNELILTQDYDDQVQPGALVMLQQPQQANAGQFEPFGSLIDTSDVTYQSPQQQQAMYQQAYQLQQQQQLQTDMYGNVQQAQNYSANTASSNAYYAVGQDPSQAMLGQFQDNTADQQTMLYQQQQQHHHHHSQQASSFQTMGTPGALSPGGSTNPFTQTFSATSSATTQSVQQSMTQQNQQQQFALDQQSQYTQNSHMYQSTANTGDLLGSGNLALTGTSPLISSASGVPSLNAQLGTGFDGGNQAKPLPFQNNDSPNAKIAEIARNSNQIDPFASLASSRAMGASMSTLHGPGASNPFAMTGTNQSVPASSTPDLLGDSGGGLGMTTQPQMSSLVDLSPASLGNNTNNTSSTALTTSISSSLGFGPAVNKNPFATGTSSTWSSQKTSKVSLNDLIKRQQQSHSRPVSPHHNPYASQQMASSTNSFHTQNSSSNVLHGMGHLNLGSPNFTPTNGAGTPSGFGQLHSTNTPMFQQQTQQSSNLYSNHTTFHSIGPSGTSGVNANPFGVNPSGGGGAPTSFNNISHNTANTFNPF